MPLPHKLLDRVKPPRWQVILELKTVVKILVAPNTSDDPGQRHGPDAPNAAIKGGFLPLVIAKALDRCFWLITLEETFQLLMDLLECRFQGGGSHRC